MMYFMNIIKKIITVSIFIVLAVSDVKADEYGVHAVVISDEFTGKFESPSSLFYDEAKERLYVVDSGNGRLISYDSNLEYLSEWASVDLKSPVSLVKNSKGKFYALDVSTHEIKYLDPKLGEVRALTFEGVPKGKVVFIPGRIAIDSNDSLYIIDKMNKRIVVLDSEEKYSYVITVKGKDFNGFNDVRVSSNGTVAAIDTIGRKAYLFDNKGKLQKSFGGPGYKSGGGSLFFPVSLDIDDLGNIYILDSHIGKIYVYDKDGFMKYSISERGFNKGSLHDPVYILIDGKRRLYTLESGRIQILKRVNE